MRYDKIYLQDLGNEVTWCEDKIHDDDVEYVLKEKIEEYTTFCIECDRRKLPLITFDDWLERVEHHEN